MDTNLDTSSVQELAGKLLKKLDQAIEELGFITVGYKEKSREEGREITKDFPLLIPGGAVDRQGLRQLTQVLKDLQIITGSLTELEMKERLAKLSQLEAACAAENPGPETVKVVFAAGKEEWNE